MTGELRQLHNEELRDLHCSSHVILVMYCVGLVGGVWGGERLQGFGEEA